MFQQLISGFTQSRQGQTAFSRLQAQGFSPQQAHGFMGAAVPTAARALHQAGPGAARPGGPQGLMDVGGSHYVTNFLSGAVSGLIRGQGMMGAAVDGVQGVAGGHVAQVIATRFGLPQRVAGTVGAIVTPLVIDWLFEAMGGGLDLGSLFGGGAQPGGAPAPSGPTGPTAPTARGGGIGSMMGGLMGGAGVGGVMGNLMGGGGGGAGWGGPAQGAGGIAGVMGNLMGGAGATGQGGGMGAGGIAGVMGNLMGGAGGAGPGGGGGWGGASGGAPSGGAPPGGAPPGGAGWGAASGGGAGSTGQAGPVSPTVQGGLQGGLGALFGQFLGGGGNR